MSLGWPFKDKTVARADGRVPSDPVAVAAVQGGQTAADAYRAVRAALRVDQGIARVGNRFVRLDRFREIAFLAVGRAAASMALGTLAGLGKRLTQGLLIGPDRPPPELPFHSRPFPFRAPGEATDGAAGAEAFELVEGLGESDLLIVLLSAGALSALAAPPDALGAGAWADWLGKARAAGASAAQLTELIRVLGGGAVGGRLARRARQCPVATMVVDRGDGVALLGGGPMVPVARAERDRVRATLASLGLSTSLPPELARALDEPVETAMGRHVGRPVIVASPSDALRGAAEAVAERRWAPRLLEDPGGPDAAAAARAFARSAEERRQAEPAGADRRGMALFARTTFGTVEGDDERVPLRRFLDSVGAQLARRDATVAAFQTGGSSRPDPEPAGAVVSAQPAGGGLRPLTVPPGLTDVGTILLALLPEGP